MENLWVTKILNFMWQKNPSTVENLGETLDAVLVFYAIGYPYVVKVWVYYSIGYPHTDKHMGTNTTQCTIGVPEVKIAFP